MTYIYIPSFIRSFIHSLIHTYIHGFVMCASHAYFVGLCRQFRNRTFGGLTCVAATCIPAVCRADPRSPEAKNKYICTYPHACTGLPILDLPRYNLQKSTPLGLRFDPHIRQGSKFPTIPINTPGGLNAVLGLIVCQARRK